MLITIDSKSKEVFMVTYVADDIGLELIFNTLRVIDTKPSIITIVVSKASSNTTAIKNKVSEFRNMV